MRYGCLYWSVLLIALGTSQVWANEPIPVSSMLAEDGKLVYVPARAGGAGEGMAAGLRMSVAVEAGFRVYQAQYKDKTHYAHVALGDNTTHLAFDTSEKKFRRMLASIRVELQDYGLVDEIVRAVRGTGAKTYESLGFALIRLPGTTNPASAADMLASDARVLSVRIRLEELPIIPM